MGPFSHLYPSNNMSMHSSIFPLALPFVRVSLIVISVNLIEHSQQEVQQFRYMQFQCNAFSIREAVVVVVVCFSGRMLKKDETEKIARPSIRAACS